MPQPLRFAIFGTGFWARYQLAAWRELPGAECIALYNRTRSKAEALGKEFGISHIYDDAERLLAIEKPDFVDIISSVESHAPLTALALHAGVPVICQKPMAPNLAEAMSMAEEAAQAKVPLYIHENWRWQHPIRQFKHQLDRSEIGRPFRARINYCSSSPVFINQPFLKTLEKFILADMGSHLMDVTRFLFGEARSLACLTQRIHPDISGEDVASVLMRMENGMAVELEISYASRTEHERFPQTFIHIEGERGSLELAPDYWIRETTAAGTYARRVPPTHYGWADPAYDVVHSSIVACNTNLLGALQGACQAETTASDNLRTLQLVYAAYDAAWLNKVVSL